MSWAIGLLILVGFYYGSRIHADLRRIREVVDILARREADRIDAPHRD